MVHMYRKIIIQDFIGVWLLFTGCLLGGLVANEIRLAPLPLVYSSPESRLNQTVEHLGATTSPSSALEGDVKREEMQKISSNRLALILDARPEIFYRLGHIPSALSLPRDDFEKSYGALQSTLVSYRDKPLVVYCSSTECHDSQMVADALQKLGYEHVRLFRGGWSEWENASLPEEKE
jgi:rhodanese-related sulfurtransferase